MHIEKFGLCKFVQNASGYEIMIPATTSAELSSVVSYTGVTVTNCSYAYSGWSAFGACSTGCGVGTQTQTRSCIRSTDGASVSCAYCGGVCTNTQSCSAYWYNWGAFGAFGACDNSCGVGNQYSYRACYRCDGAVVADANCSGLNYQTQSCSAYWYYYTAYTPLWSACSTTCGSGLRYKTRGCNRCDGAAVGCASCGGDCTLSQVCSTNIGCAASGGCTGGTKYTGDGCGSSTCTTGCGDGP